MEVKSIFLIVPFSTSSSLSPGSSITLALQGLPESQGVASFGVPGFSVFLANSSTGDCRVLIDTPQKRVTVEITAYRMDSSQPSKITASYPTVTTYYGGSVKEAKCSDSITISKTVNGIEVTS